VDSRLFVRVHGAAAPMIPAIRREILALDPDVHIGQESTLRQTVERSVSLQKLMARLLAFSAAMAALLTAIGLYATLAFTVGQRRRELAIRSAVGARTSEIFRLVLRSGAALTCAGIAIGTALALASSRLLSSYLYGVDPANVRTYTAAAVLLSAVSILACIAPARAATRIEPIEALRAE
jgi:ABC-type antimicrobial peptide transport system permease subunit